VAGEDPVDGQRGRLAREQGPPSALPLGWAHRALANRVSSHEEVGVTEWFFVTS
jgi:hypothetical protein